MRRPPGSSSARDLVAGFVGLGAGLVCILQQVEQRLLHLRRVDASVQLRRALFEGEGDLLAQAFEEGGPIHGLQLRLRQLGKARIAADEALQVTRAPRWWQTLRPAARCGRGAAVRPRSAPAKPPAPANC
jgi:hypothetical protein